jgi:tetratricopeptide (TPR) repeat protein
VAGLVAALVLVFLAGLVGVLWQWQIARHHAAAYKEERDTARRQRERAEHHLGIVRGRVDGLAGLGRDLLKLPGQHKAGKAVLEEALTLYEDLLPEEGSDAQLRLQAVWMYRQVAGIRHTLGQLDQAVEAYAHETALLTDLLAGPPSSLRFREPGASPQAALPTDLPPDEPADKVLRRQLARSHRSRGNAQRDRGKWQEAREAYDQAARLFDGLHLESPKDPAAAVALSNTLLNTITVLPSGDRAEELERLFGRILELDRAAVAAAPSEHSYQAELALALHDQGLFFLETGRTAKAEDAIREALAIHRKVLTGGRHKGYIEPYVARNYATLGRVLAAAGRGSEAEPAFREAVKLLEQYTKELPEHLLHRRTLARTLAELADFLEGSGRPSEGEGILRQAIGQYELLKEDREYQGKLAVSYLKLVRLLGEHGRQGEAGELLHKARTVDPENPAVNNEVAWFLATTPEPRLRDPAEAVRRARKAVDADKESGEYWNTLGVAHYRNGEDRAAIAALEASMRLRDGGDGYDWFFLAMAHGRLGDRDRARIWLDRAVQWMDTDLPRSDDLRRFRAEAKALLAEPAKP